MYKILLVDDDVDILKIFSLLVSDEGYECFTAATAELALDVVQAKNPDLVFLDIQLPKMGGIECLKRIKQINRNIEIISITAFETVQNAVEAMRLGAYDYVSKPFDNEKLKILMKNALEKKRLSDEVVQLKGALKGMYDLDELSKARPQIQGIFDLVRKVAPYNLSVLIQGKSGTGKELIARVIHHNSTRRDKPFIPIDCAVLPETLIESELFGYEKGAFTGADKQKPGKFELAEKGTLFLDEIGNLSLNVQVKLLRVLQEKQIERLGGKKPIKIDVRIISATNADLEASIKKGLFREDLYHRLKEFPIYLPPLKKRPEDMVLLAKHFLKEFNLEFAKNVEDFCHDTIKIFQSYSWPGNVRELKNVVRAAVILCDEETIGLKNLPVEIQNCGSDIDAPEGGGRI